MQLPDWYTRAQAEGRVRRTDPKTENFSFREWVYGISARLRFWDKRFRAPYKGLTARQAFVLMRLRGERPLAVEDFQHVLETDCPFYPRERLFQY